MAKLQKILNLEVPAGNAQPAPPLWPMLGANGVNIGQFIKEFNGKTMDLMKQFGDAKVKIRCQLKVFVDRTFEIILQWPVTSNLILWKISQKKGSWEPNKTKIGTISRKDLEEIADMQLLSMNTNDKEAVIRTIAGTAKNMGVEIEKGALKMAA